MIHILLTILKILGILLLIILGIVLFLVLAILFVPFRYAVWGEKHEKNIKGKVVFSWLAHLVHVRFVIENKEKNMELYLFGIPVFASKNKITEICQKLKKKEDKLNADTKEELDEMTEVIKEADAESSTLVENSEAKVSCDEASEAEVEESVAEEKELSLDATTESLSLKEISEEEADIEQTESQETFEPEKKNPIKGLIQTVKEIPVKIKASVEKIKLTITNICDKIKRGSSFLRAEATKETIRLLLGKLKRILGHILPKKLSGDITFGFDDPALTGELLGVVAMFYPKYHDKLKIYPVFGQMVLEGNVMVKGRIIAAYFILQAIKVLLDKNVRITWTNIKK